MRGKHARAGALLAAVVTLAGLEGRAAADGEAGPAPAPNLPSLYQPKSEIGVAFTAGAGVADFAHGDARTNTGLGPAWTLRASAGTRRHVGVEATYVGSAQSIHGLGLADSKTLLTNGVEGAVRVTAQIKLDAALGEIFVLGGLGWARYTVSGLPAATANLHPSDDVLTTPFGGGIALCWRGFYADARFIFRPTFRESLITGTSNGDLTNWGVGLSAGYEL